MHDIEGRKGTVWGAYQGVMMARCNNLDDDGEIAAFWASCYLDRMKADPSYMPPGYDPQVDRAEVMRVLKQMVARQG